VGAALLVVCYFIARHLITIGPRYAGHEPPTVYLLAMIAFMCGSMGAASLVQGRHLFDQVERSQRWHSPEPGPSLQSEWVPELDGKQKRKF
jgi:hypothetical protein